MQKQRIFFGENDPWGREEPTEQEKLWAVSRDNPDCPLNKFIGNEKAIKKLQAAAFTALGHPNHLCREIAFSIFGPASSGKTSLVKLFAETVQLPFVEFSPQVKSTDAILKEIARVLAVSNTPLLEYKRKDYFELPPSIIFFDEIHAVSDNVIQALLKATEYNDGLLVTEKNLTVDCRKVCWMIATTDEGLLFDAFRSRFSPLYLTYLNKREIGKIVNKAHPDISLEHCELIAFYNSRVPRKALEFARYVKMVKGMNPSKDWSDVINEVASDEGIDSNGISKIHRSVLEILSKGATPKNRLAIMVGRKIEEVERYVMPWLLCDTDDSKALVTVSNKGYILTSHGIELCSKYGYMKE